MDNNSFDPHSFNDEDNKPVTLPSSEFPASVPVISPVVKDTRRSRTIRWVIIVLVIAVFCLIPIVILTPGDFRSPLAPESSYSYYSEVPPTAVPTPILFLTPHLLVPTPPGAVILKDSFDSNDLGWKAFDNNSTVVIANGKLYLRANQGGNYGAAVCEGCSIFKDDFYFQADINATRSFHGGLIFSWKGPYDFYVFQIESCCQKYSLLKHTAGGWEDLKLLISSTAININPNPNTLAVLFLKGQITLYINGVRVDSINDPNAIMGGQVGMMIAETGMDEIGDNVFSYRVQDNILASPTPITSTPQSTVPDNTLAYPTQFTLPIQPGCIPWDQVTSADVGKSMCVTGIIVQRNYVYDSVNYNDSYTSYQFTKTDPDAFRFTWSYGDYSRPSISECVNVTGIVMINGKSLYMKYPFLSKCTP